MNKISFIFSVALLTLSGALVFQSAQADDQCRDIRSRVKVVSFDCNPLYFDENYFCFVAELKGKTKGAWFTGIRYGWDGLFVDDFLPTPDDTLNWWWREHEVFELKGGTLTGDAQYVIDLRVYEVGADIPVPVTVTGGTGIYEDATGWILGTFDASFEKGRIYGEVCGPYISGQKDDDDDDDDDD